MIKKILVSLDVLLIDRLDKFANEFGFNRVQAIRYILKVFLDEHENK